MVNRNSTGEFGQDRAIASHSGQTLENAEEQREDQVYYKQSRDIIGAYSMNESFWWDRRGSGQYLGKANPLSPSLYIMQPLKVKEPCHRKVTRLIPAMS